MESSSNQHDDGVVSFDLVGDARVSGYGKGVVMASDQRISGVLENGGNGLRFNGEDLRSGLVDDPKIGTNLVVSGLNSKVSEVGELPAINLVVDLSHFSTKEANDVKFTEKGLPVGSFKPAKIIQCVQDLAKDPFGMSFLEVLTIGGHLSAFNHWKGYYQLHNQEILDGIDDELIYGNSEEVTKTEKLNDCSRKLNDMFDGGLSPIKKVKRLSDLMSKCSHVSDVEYKPKKRGRKRKILEFNKDEFLSQIYIAAINPIQKQQNLDSLVRFSSDFRNYRMDQTEEIEIHPEVSEEDGLITGIKENSATALILKFTDLESVPPVTKMNEIFGRYGSLQEHETQVLKKNKCVKMVFERRCDAETAFSSSGKFSIFGPALVSYCLNFSPTPRKRRTGGRNQNKNGMKSVKRMLFED